MMNFEDPIQFDIRKNFDNIEIEFSELMEISQGGPIAGDMAINGKTVNGRFGGPILYKDGYVYAPAHVKRFLGTGFRLSRINIHSFEKEYLGKTKFVIFLDRIEDNRVYFFEDMGKTVPNYYEI